MSDKEIESVVNLPSLTLISETSVKLRVIKTLMLIFLFHLRFFPLILKERIGHFTFSTIGIPMLVDHVVVMLVLFNKLHVAFFAVILKIKMD